MMTFRQIAVNHKYIPTATSWYLGDLGEARGKQELFTRQSPQRLNVLREHALIESAVSSNRIEEKTILKLHRLARGKIWDVGKYKERDCNIIEKYANGTSRVRFKNGFRHKNSGRNKRITGSLE